VTLAPRSAAGRANAHVKLGGRFLTWVGKNDYPALVFTCRDVRHGCGYLGGLAWSPLPLVHHGTDAVLLGRRILNFWYMTGGLPWV
jgi:hypothetical protein